MSGQEIERKFLVTDNSYKTLAHARHTIRQGYICSGGGRTVRVRQQDNHAYLTIKGPSADGGLSRYEFETEIAPTEAAHLFALCEPGLISKTRHLVASGKHTFEVDEFYGENEGLVVAEVELNAPDEPFTKPPFIGREVTGDKRYYNSHLRAHPYSEWKEER